MAAPLRHGIHFAIRHPHEAAHLDPLRERLHDVAVDDPEEAAIVVSADARVPVSGAWDVQVFHGLGDKGYTLNPIFLQRGRFPRLRTAANRILRAFRLPAPFLKPPAEPGRRPGRYQQANAYGPMFKDRLEDMLEDTHVTEFGHLALNDRGSFDADPDGPVLWLPTWDNRKYLGGQQQSSLAPFAHEVALVSRHVPVLIKYHPLTLVHDQDKQARAELEAEPGVTIVPADLSPYDLLDGVRGVLTDTSSLGFEAYCGGLPVGLVKPKAFRYEGLHAELAERVMVMRSGRPDLLRWAESPDRDADKAFIRDLLYTPSADRNDAFAADLRARLDTP